MIAGTEAFFVSRGDDSGTHLRELELWDAAGVDVASADPAWYRGTGAGMGATLNSAAAMNAYVLVDRASWLNFAKPGGTWDCVSGRSGPGWVRAFQAVRRPDPSTQSGTPRAEPMRP